MGNRSWLFWMVLCFVFLFRKKRVTADIAATAREVYNHLIGCGCSKGGSETPPPNTGCLGVGETGFPQGNHPN